MLDFNQPAPRAGLPQRRCTRIVPPLAAVMLAAALAGCDIASGKVDEHAAPKGPPPAAVAVQKVQGQDLAASFDAALQAVRSLLERQTVASEHA